MTPQSGAALAIWLALSVASLWWWMPPRHRPAGRAAAVVTVVLVAGCSAVVAVLASLSPALPAEWRWVGVAVAAGAAVLAGGALSRCVLALADGTAQAGPVVRVQPAVLPGGAWIGALERLLLVGTLLAGWPDGVAVLIGVKGLARYPELKTGQGSGASERFIIGTLVSLGFGAACGGIVHLLSG